MSLPVACSKCSPFGGLWMQTEEGLKRCDCLRGRALDNTGVRDDPRQASKPVISVEAATFFVEALAAMEYFPREAAARSIIGEELSAMCFDEKQAMWLVKRMVSLYAKWPGVIEMRRIYCLRYRPLDGREAIGESEIYPGGIPSDLPAAKPVEFKRVRDGAVNSDSPSIEATIQDLATATNLNLVRRRPNVREIPITRITDKNRITEKDFEEAEKKYREEKARQERAADEITITVDEGQ